MYTLYNDFKYKNTYLRVCIPYIRINIPYIIPSSCMYTLYNDFKYKNTYLRVCIPYIMTLMYIRINTFVYVYLI